MTSEGGAEERERYLGVSTADKVLKHWQHVLQDSTKRLRMKSANWDARYQMTFEGPPLFSRCSGEGVEDTLEEALNLRDSAAGLIIEAMAGTMKEARDCVRQAPSIYRELAVFGEIFDDAPEESQQTEALIEIAEVLPSLLMLVKLLKKVSKVAEHLLRQLVGVHRAAAEAEDMRGLEKRLLRPALDLLGELLMVPVIVDGLILENETIKSAFKTYSWVVKKMSDPDFKLELIDVPATAAQGIQEVLETCKGLMEAECFNRCMETVAEAAEECLSGATGENLRLQMLQYFHLRLEESKLVNADSMTGEIGRGTGFDLPCDVICPWICTFALHAAIWEPKEQEAKLVSELWTLHRRSPVIPVEGKIQWSIVDFLLPHLPDNILDSASAEELRRMATVQADNLDQGQFVEEMKAYRTAVQIWLGGLGAASRSLGRGSSLKETFKSSQKVIVEGMQLANKIRTCLQEYISLHAGQDSVQMHFSCLQYVSLGFQLLKAIETGPSSPRWAEHTFLLSRGIALRLHHSLEKQRAGLQAQGDLKAEDALNIALQALYNMIGGSPANKLDWYIDVAGLALSMAGQGDLLSVALADKAGQAGEWRRFIYLMTWTKQLQKLCDCSWIYYIKEYIPYMIKATRGSADQIEGISGLPRLCNAIAEPLNFLVPPDTELGKLYIKDIRAWLQEDVVGPLIQAVEDDLRTYSFAVIQNSLDKLPAAPPRSALMLMRLRPICVGQNMILNIRNQVERTLSKKFYDINAVFPQDDEQYHVMRSLAKERFGLDLLDGYLPKGSLNHSLDVIDIMRNIHLFAMRFNYSVHQQIFTQGINKGADKLRVITMDQLANSIHTHGTGVISTTVNYTYGFVKRQLEVAIAFLQDPDVKSRLMFEERYAIQRRARRQDSIRKLRKAGMNAFEKENLPTQEYTWARALETRQFIRREVGTAPDGVPLIDKFVQTVTRIGNAIGYMRLVKNAGMRCNANSLPYVQVAAVACAIGRRQDGKMAVTTDDDESDDDKSEKSSTSKARDDIFSSKRSHFAEAAKKAGCPDLVNVAATVADDAVEAANLSFETSTDYLNILAGVFNEVLAHMKEDAGSPAHLFHLLIPTMTLSFIDSLRVSKQALMRRAVATVKATQSNAACFDDGFAVGVALILRIFASERDFQALHWFDAKVSEQDAEQAPKISHDEFYEENQEPVEGRATRSEREILQHEFRRLAATFDAALSLFGTKRNPPPDAEDDNDNLPDAPGTVAPSEAGDGDDDLP